jgi:PhzF family phenazine biosynthesis protein
MNTKKMKIKIYQIDAFADKVFSGNPAAVCPLNSWLPDKLLQNIAMENNLAETCFYVKQSEKYEVRWFTPAVEVDLCGHATLAAAYVLYQYDGHKADAIQFYSPRSGSLSVTREGDLLTLDFPTDVFEKVALVPELTDGFNYKPLEAFKGKTDYMLVFNDEDEIRNMQPDLSVVAKLVCRGVIVTAKGESVDFVSRFFAPQSGIPEDPVTGSAHTTLTPYWSDRLEKKELSAIQLSARKGYLQCKNLNERTAISGYAKTYMLGEIEINDFN